MRASPKPLSAACQEARALSKKPVINPHSHNARVALANSSVAWMRPDVRGDCWII
jgi:hypothetical protein